MYKTVLIVLLALSFSACGADVSKHDTGIPPHEASRFYLAVENVSRDLGLTTSKATETSLTVAQPTVGSIMFTGATGDIHAIATPHGDSTELRAANQLKLEKLYRALLAKSEREDIQRFRRYTH